MPETFQCPACGAPLNITSSAATLHCPYCNNVVIVPETLRGSAPETPMPNNAIDPARIQEIVAIARGGNKIEAIKRYRQLTEVGLKEAKDAVEALMEGRPVEIRATQRASIGVGEDLVALVRSGKKIEAIKRYRELTNVGLKEAKDAVEAMEAAQTWGNTLADEGGIRQYAARPSQTAGIPDPESSQSASCLARFLVMIIVLAILLGCLTPLILFFFNPSGQFPLP